jgi:hypothetical protein
MKFHVVFELLRNDSLSWVGVVGLTNKGLLPRFSDMQTILELWGPSSNFLRPSLSAKLRIDSTAGEDRLLKGAGAAREEEKKGDLGSPKLTGNHTRSSSKYVRRRRRNPLRGQLHHHRL